MSNPLSYRGLYNVYEHLLAFLLIVYKLMIPDFQYKGIQGIYYNASLVSTQASLYSTRLVPYKLSLAR